MDLSDPPLPLFPLGTALLPGGLLSLRIFEVRYLDLISRCLREGSGFGVVALQAGSEVRRSGETVELAGAGCLAEIVDCDASTQGLLQLRCRGTRRFELAGPAQAQADGLWIAPVRWLPPEPAAPVPEDLRRTARALGEALAQLAEQGIELHLPPEQLDDAAWVAYRWCELLSLSNTARLTLMQLDDPVARLRTIDHMLGQHALSATADTPATPPGPTALH